MWSGSYTAAAPEAPRMLQSTPRNARMGRPSERSSAGTTPSAQAPEDWFATTEFSRSEEDGPFDTERRLLLVAKDIFDAVCAGSLI
jgi:hypothetical protein